MCNKFQNQNQSISNNFPNNKSPVKNIQPKLCKNDPPTPINCKNCNPLTFISKLFFLQKYARYGKVRNQPNLFKIFIHSFIHPFILIFSCACGAKCFSWGSVMLLVLGCFQNTKLLIVFGLS